MNGELEKRLSDFIETAAKHQGRVDSWMENFDERVLPRLVTQNFCAARHHELKLEIAEGELGERRANNRMWRNRIWAALVALVLLLAGHWLGERSESRASAEPERDVPQSRMELHR